MPHPCSADPPGERWSCKLAGNECATASLLLRGFSVPAALALDGKVCLSACGAVVPGGA